MQRRRFSTAAWSTLLALVAPVLYGQDRADADRVLALFAARCVACHSGPGAAVGLRLDSRQGVIAGSGRGPVVIAGDPGRSELLRRIRGDSLPRMPLTGPPYLATDEVALIERWIFDGMPEGVEASPPAVPPRPGPGEAVTYAHVAPLFARHCARCHAERGLMGAPPEGYLLTGLDDVLAADDRVRVVPGNPGASELVRRIRGQSLPRMPFDGPPFLDDEEIVLIERWIAQGARDADGHSAPVPGGARVRLHGTLTGRMSIDGLELVPGPRMRIDKSPVPGSRVEVRGRIDAAGRVVVERLRRR